MQNKNLTPPPSENLQQQILKARIAQARGELEMLQQEIHAFENILRTHLTHEIIEEQELSVLYKNLRQEKKDKRQKQAQKGKNFKPGKEIKSSGSLENTTRINSNQKELKRLYREAMLHAHPDKFSLAHEHIELATAVTSRLIEIYKRGDLKELQQYHIHILSGNAISADHFASHNKELLQKDNFLQHELQELLTLIAEEKNKATYKVLREYEDPLLYVQELKAYYEDRLGKLRKRTRKG